jgi:low affinity Fe/Cu permease
MTDRLPSSVSPDLNLFDRFASAVGRFVSRAPFFAAAVLIVILWLTEGVVRMIVNGPSAFLDQVYQLQINTVTTVITFLLVALLQNTQSRDTEAVQEKLNAISLGLADLMEDVSHHLDTTELREAVGLEKRVGADDQ